MRVGTNVSEDREELKLLVSERPLTTLLTEQAQLGEAIGAVAAGGELDVEPLGERFVGVPGPDGFEGVREVVGQLTDDALVGAARREAGQAMTQAWRTDPIASDEGMPLGVGLTFPEMERRREEYIEAVRWQLQWLPARWVRAHVIPWILELPRRSKDGG